VPVPDTVMTVLPAPVLILENRSTIPPRNAGRVSR